MATKKKPKAQQQEDGVAQQQGFTQNQQTLITLMSGVYAQNGLPLAGAQQALQGRGDAGQELLTLVQAGFAFQNGNGLYQLTRDQQGNFVYATGVPAQPQQAPTPAPTPMANPPSMQQAPQQPQMAAPQPAATPQQATPNNAPATGVEDDDLPWMAEGRYQEAILERLDTLIEIGRGLQKALGVMVVGGEAAPPPPAQATNPQQPQQTQQNVPQWPPQGQPAQPPAPTWPQQQAPQGQQQWQQPQFQQPGPYPVPQQQVPQQPQFQQPGFPQNGSAPQQNFGYPVPGYPQQPR